MHGSHRRSKNGLTLVEVVVSSMLVGVVLVGAMNCVGAVVSGRMSAGDSGHARQLARQLMEEVLTQSYEEPADTPTFGRESPESGGQRTDWDDVDDYHQWSSSPPENRTGTAIPNSAGWQRDVIVQWVDPNDPSQVSGVEQGVKRVTVTVRRNGQILAQETALRSDKVAGFGL